MSRYTPQPCRSRPAPLRCDVAPRHWALALIARGENQTAAQLLRRTLDVVLENYEKYGHPDGRQSTSVGVALPTWLFNNDHAALLLGLIVMVGILAPMVGAIMFLKRSKKKTGSDVMIETVQLWAHPQSPGSV